MREVSAFIKDWLGITFGAPVVRPGRPRKGTLKLRGLIPGEPLPDDFYKYVSGLSKAEIPAFIKQYSVLAPLVARGTFATQEEVLEFQRDLRLIADNLRKLEPLRKNKALTWCTIKRATTPKDGDEWSLLPVLNRYLSGCRLAFDFVAVPRKGLTKEEKQLLEEQLADGPAARTGYLDINESDVLNVSVDRTRRRGFNTPVLEIQSLHIFSWCVLCLVTDISLRHRVISACVGCGCLFEVKHQNQQYCGIKSCSQKPRAAKRKAKSRRAHKVESR